MIIEYCLLIIGSHLQSFIFSLCLHWDRIKVKFKLSVNWKCLFSLSHSLHIHSLTFTDTIIHWIFLFFVYFTPHLYPPCSASITSCAIPLASCVLLRVFNRIQNWHGGAHIVQFYHIPQVAIGAHQQSILQSEAHRCLRDWGRKCRTQVPN